MTEKNIFRQDVESEAQPDQDIDGQTVSQILEVADIAYYQSLKKAINSSSLQLDQKKKTIKELKADFIELVPEIKNLDYYYSIEDARSDFEKYEELPMFESKVTHFALTNSEMIAADISEPQAIIFMDMKDPAHSQREANDLSFSIATPFLKNGMIYVHNKDVFVIPDVLNPESELINGSLNVTHISSWHDGSYCYTTGRDFAMHKYNPDQHTWDLFGVIDDLDHVTHIQTLPNFSVAYSRGKLITIARPKSISRVQAIREFDKTIISLPSTILSFQVMSDSRIFSSSGSKIYLSEPEHDGAYKTREIYSAPYDEAVALDFKVIANDRIVLHLLHAGTDVLDPEDDHWTLTQELDTGFIAQSHKSLEVLMDGTILASDFDKGIYMFKGVND